MSRSGLRVEEGNGEPLVYIGSVRSGADATGKNSGDLRFGTSDCSQMIYMRPDYGIEWNSGEGRVWIRLGRRGLYFEEGALNTEGILFGSQSYIGEDDYGRLLLRSGSGVIINGKSLVDTIYPVGSIYTSVNSTDPGTLFGGTWERIKGRFLFAGYDVDAPKVGDTGGETSHTLTVDELPSHAHTAKGRSVYAGSGSYTALTSISTGTTDYLINAGGGSGNAHNNMPPYLAVYMWKRTA